MCKIRFKTNMKPIRLIFALCSLAGCGGGIRSARHAIQPGAASAAAYAELPIGAVKPAGWLNEQLVRMRDGMTGHLDSLYPQVMGPRNGWLGGDGDVWERGPYWIDGLLPLAYILEDRRLIAKVQPWIEWALASQTADGNFGPVTDRPAEPGLQRDKARDWWPRMVVLKVLQQYHSATGRSARLGFHGPLFPLPAGAASPDAPRQLDQMGARPRRRQPRGGLLALQPHG